MWRFFVADLLRMATVTVVESDAMEVLMETGYLLLDAVDLDGSILQPLGAERQQRVNLTEFALEEHLLLAAVVHLNTRPTQPVSYSNTIRIFTYSTISVLRINLT